MRVKNQITSISAAAIGAGCRRPMTAVAALTVAAVTLSACSRVPDAINPAAWYRTTAEAISGDSAKESVPANPDNELQAQRGSAPPGADGKTPNLSRVNQQVAAREAMTEGLAADTQGRKYDNSVQRQGSAGAQNSLYADDKPPAPPAVETQTAAPAPAPQPAAPVQTATPTPQPADSTTASAAPAPSAPDNSGGVDEGMRDRLARQLAEIRARAADQGSLLLPDLYDGNGQSTIIVSSSGIETAMVPGMPSSGGGVMGMGPEGVLPPGSATKVATILFNNGSASLDTRDRQILADVVRLQQQRGGTVHIVGHASQRTRNMDPVQHKKANFDVSIQRANQVAEALKRLGVDSNKVMTAAVGDAQPIYLEVMPSGEAGNRRTEIYLTN